jgi:hypothetical protein
VSFATLVAQDGRGIWWGLEVSFDNFATVAYRWGTASGVVEGDEYERRILSGQQYKMPDYTRALGVDHLPAAATWSCELDNLDGGADWLADLTKWASQTVRARYRLRLGLYNPSDGIVATQVLGYMVAQNPPARDSAKVTLTLADDHLGQLAELLTPPTTNDWISASTEPTNPLCAATAIEQVVDFNQPWPLMFGAGLVQGLPVSGAQYPYPSSWGNPGVRPIMVCATRNLTGAGIDSLSMKVKFKEKLDNLINFANVELEVPATYYKGANSNAPVQTTIWSDQQSVTITKSGVTWKLLWIAFDVNAYQDWFYTQFANNAGQTQGSGAGFNYPFVGQSGIDGAWAAFKSFDIVSLGDLSAVTGAGNFSQNPVDVLQDLVEYYSPMYSFAGGPIDTTRFARAKTARQGYRVKGMIAVPFASTISTAAAGTSSKLVYEAGLLSKALAEVCGSADIDLFLTYSGQVGCAVQVSDFTQQTTTFPSIDETKVKQDSILENVPGANQRWAPYNAVFIRSPDGSGEELGPFRNEAAITAWGGQVLERHIEGSWWLQLFDLMTQGGVNFSDTQNLVWSTRGLESVARPLISFDTDFTFFALGIDLCDDFTFTWTRGGTTTLYNGSLFRLETLIVHPDEARVTVVAIWMGDFAQVQPYLLDDETLVLRKNSSGGRTATVADTSSTVTFSSGSLITDGVQAGDHLILKDTTESAVAFKRNRALKIASITDATHLVVTDPSLDFGGGAAVASWEIRKSYLTYPTSVSDPTHYPNGAAMYGKVSDGTGKYSDASAANELLDG